MTINENELAIARVADREAIRDVMYRYCRSVDRLDLERLRDCYHPDAYDNHGAYQGDLDGLIAWIARRHASIPYSMHTIGNILIEFASDDLALVESYHSLIQHYSADAKASLGQFLGPDATTSDGALNLLASGRFVDRVLRRDGQWKIIRRTVVAGPMMVLPATGPLGAPAGWVTDQRDDQDALFLERRELGIG